MLRFPKGTSPLDCVHVATGKGCFHLLIYLALLKLLKIKMQPDGVAWKEKTKKIIFWALKVSIFPKR